MDEPREIGVWKLICVLGAGAFGKVSLWRNNINEECVAVKKCKFHLSRHLSQRQRERWMNEVEIMKSIVNDNIVRYKQLPPDLETAMQKYNPTRLPILSMEYCSKGNLRRYLLQTKNLKGCEEIDVRYILEDVANAVSYLHSRNITHRDIKPENIVIQECNDRKTKSIYKLIDLGYAKELETIASFVGTLPYLAPEIYYAQSYDSSVDYWSIGILTYEIITAQHPFLPDKSPVERFKYLKEKSDEHISITLSKDGLASFSREISPCNNLTSVFKRDIEDWLRLLLKYDSNKRGLCNNVKKDVFEELKMLLKKRILQVFSVFNYRALSYEIDDSTRLVDIKSLIEKDTLIPKNFQVFVVDRDSILFDDKTSIIDFFENDVEPILYVFKKNNDFEPRTVAIPPQVQELFQPVSISHASVLKNLYSYAIFFIYQERRLLEQFNSAFILQVDRTMLLFKRIKTLYCELRRNVSILIARIEYYNELNGRQDNSVAVENEKYRNCLKECKKSLRQAKELTENFNSLTGWFLKTLGMEWVSKFTEPLKKALRSSEKQLQREYENAIRLYLKADSSNLSSTEMIQTVSNVLKITRTMIFKNDDLKRYLRCVTITQRRLQRLLVWGNAIDGAVKTVSTLMCECERAKCEYVRNFTTRKCVAPLRITVDLNDDTAEVDRLINENQSLRYRIQDMTDKNSTYIREMQRDFLSFWNGIILPTS